MAKLSSKITSSFLVEPSIRVGIDGTSGQYNTLNSSDNFINFNFPIWNTDSGTFYFQAHPARNLGNIAVYKPGMYEVDIRYVSYDLQTTSTMRLSLWRSTTGVINTGYQAFINPPTIVDRFNQQDRSSFGVQNYTPVGGSTYYFVRSQERFFTNVTGHFGLSIYHTNGTALAGTAAYPNFDNNEGLRPIATIRRLGDV